MEEFISLLEKVDEIKQRDDRRSAERRSTGDNFNVFTIMGVAHYETKLSRFLAELLNPKGRHDCGAFFLDSFLDILLSQNLKKEELVLEMKKHSMKVKVSTEKVIRKRRRLDILVELGNRQLIIENKIHAQDRDNQINAYVNNAVDSGKEYILLYLTPHGHAPSTNSTADASKYEILSYETVAEWLILCALRQYAKPNVYLAMLQFHDHVKYIIGQGVKKIMGKEIVNLLMEANNIELAELMAKNLNTAIKKSMDFILDDLAEFARDTKLSMKKNWKEDKHYILQEFSNICFSKEGWDISIVFEFKGKNCRDLHYGIKYNEQNQKKLKVLEQETVKFREHINKNEQILDIIPVEFNKYCWIWKAEVEDAYRNWNAKALTYDNRQKLLGYIKERIQLLEVWIEKYKLNESGV